MGQNRPIFLNCPQIERKSRAVPVGWILLHGLYAVISDFAVHTGLKRGADGALATFSGTVDTSEIITLLPTFALDDLVAVG